MRVASLAFLVALVVGAVLFSVLTGTAPSLSPEIGLEPPPKVPEPVDPLPTPEDPPDGGGVRGVVEWAGGGRVAGARVTAHPLGEDLWRIRRSDEPPAVAQADEIGRFALLGLEPGWYQLEAASDGGRGYVPLVRVVEGLATPVVLRLAEPAAIEGFVVDEDGSPVIGAVVSTDLGGALRAYYRAARLPDAAPTSAIQAETDGGGRFRIFPLPAGQYEVEVKADGYVDLEVAAVNAPVDDVRLTVLHGYEVRGQLAFKGVSPPSVRIFSRAPGIVDLTLEGENVKKPFVLAPIPEGRYEILATALGCAADPVRVDVVPGRSTEPIRITLSRGVRVTVRLGDSDVTDVRVRFRRFGAPADVNVPSPYHLGRSIGLLERFHRAGAPANADGAEPEPLGGILEEFERKPGRRGRCVAVLAPGLWRAEAIWSGHVVDRTPLFRAAADPLEFELMCHGGRDLIRGDVRFPDGWPIDGARVFAPSADPLDGLRSVSLPEAERPEARTVRGEYVLHPPYGYRYSLAVEPYPGAPPQGHAEPVEVGRGGRQIRRDFRVPRPENTVVRGRVVDEESEPVPGATVFFRDGIVVTDVDGRFEIHGVLPAVQTVRYLAPGWSVGFSEPFGVLEDGITKLPDLMLARRPIEVAGRVADTKGNSIPGARVEVRFAEGDRRFAATTDRNGRYVIRGPGGAEEAVTVTALATGYVTAVKETAIRPFVDDPDFVLTHAGGIRGRIRPRGNAPAGIDVVLEVVGGGRRLYFPATTDRGDVSFEVGDIPPGRWRVIVKARPYAPVDYGVLEFVESSIVDLGSIEVRPGGTIVGRVLDGARRPIRGLVVTVAGETVKTRTDNRGAFQLRPVRAGNRDLRVLRSHRVVANVPKVWVVDGELTEREVVLPD